MKKTAFLCLMLAAVLYFAGSFWQPLSLGQNGIFGYASARDMTGLQETDQMPDSRERSCRQSLRSSGRCLNFLRDARSRL